MVNASLTPVPMKRMLVLSNESAGHWFRRKQPPMHVEQLPAKAPMTDLAFFGASFISGFIIFAGMIF